jgi:hypothetical protein
VKKYLSLLLAAAVASLLMACGGGANAATLVNSFTATDGQTITNTSKIRWFYLNASGQVTAVFVNATGTSGEFSFANTANALYNKLTTSAAISASFVQMYGDSKYINIDTSREINCANNVLTVVWLPQGSSQYSDPGCAVFANIKALGN